MKRIFIFCCLWAASVVVGAENPKLRIVADSKDGPEIMVTNTTATAIYLWGYPEEQTLMYQLELKTSAGWGELPNLKCGTGGGLVEIKPFRAKTFNVYRHFGAHVPGQTETSAVARATLSYGFANDPGQITNSLASDPFTIYVTPPAKNFTIITNYVEDTKNVFIIIDETGHTNRHVGLISITIPKSNANDPGDHLTPEEKFWWIQHSKSGTQK